MQYGTLQILSDREWLLTNGLGGYAIGFGNMINKRKYNGLLISSSSQFKRIHILSTLEEKVETDGTFFFLDSNHYPNCIYPNGYNHIVKTWLRPYPSILYTSVPARENYLIFKEIFLFQRQNAVAIKYTNFGQKPIELILRPKFTLRDHHLVNSPGTWDRTSLEKEIQGDMFRIRRQDNGYEAYGYFAGGEAIESQAVYKSVYYPMEAIRGYESVEDIIAPLRINFSIPPKQSSYVVFSASPLKEPMKGAIEAEQYYKQYPLPERHPDKVSPLSLIVDKSERTTEFDKSGYHKILELASRDFIVAEDDIIAGYPWFGPWSRDTLISLSAFKYLPGGPELAIKILKKYGRGLNNGLLPNTLGEGGVGINYDSVDAPLWYVLRCYEFAPKDKDLFANISHIILHFLYDDNHPFYVAEDGLIEIRQGDHALTWMDAKVYNTPVTPRFGKPVEINALWFNALSAVKEIAGNLNIKELTADSYKCSLDCIEQMIEKVKNSLQKFVGDDYLADRLEYDRPIWEIRPNAIIALSLPFDFVDNDIMKRVWYKAKEELLTPYGLRSLNPSHPAFKQKYIGNQKQRDLMYHQGTVWTYTLLPLAKLAWKVLNPDTTTDNLTKEISGYVWTFRDGFMKGEMASVAEIWDGIDPYFPKGCPAQAWSLYALIEIEQLLLQGRSQTQ